MQTELWLWRGFTTLPWGRRRAFMLRYLWGRVLGSWDKTTRRIGVNARLFDNFDAAMAPVAVIDGKNLW